MNPNLAADTYRREAVENAPPIKIVRMLYQGALRFLDKAEACDPDGAGSEFSYWLWRADAVVSELRVSIRRDQAPEISDNLEQLYFFVEAEIARAIGTRDTTHVQNARRVLATLLEAWNRVELGAHA